jgi:diketogulonate reductase-like aldo/keto reductase
MKVPTVTLVGNVEMPVVGFGTWQLQGRHAYDAVRYALDVGYRHLDTATMYGNETEVGQALRDSGVPREDVFITTKLPPRNAGRERATITASLRDLGVDQVDLWLVHWPPRSAEALPTWREFIKARDEGLTRAIGVSNYNLSQIDELIHDTGQRPAVNQIPWSTSQYNAKLLADSRRRAVVVEGYSPLKGSNLRATALTEIAARHEVTPAQVVLRWHVEHEIPVIPKSATPERIAQNLDLFGFTLDDGEMARIDALAA